jgi:twitching motility protein PilT
VPLLDRYLEAMQKQKAEALVFRTGAAPEVLVAGAPRSISNKPATNDQIQALLAEVLGAGFHRGLLPGTPADFRYASPVGAMRINVVQDTGRIDARVELAPPEESASEPGMEELDNRVRDFLAEPEPDREDSISVMLNAPAPTPAPLAPALAVAADEDDGFSIGAPPAPVAPAPVAPVAVAAPAPAPIRPSPQVNTRITSVGAAPSRMEELFVQTIESRASDLHLKAGKPPMLRVDGEIKPIPGRDILDASAIEQLVRSIMPGENREEFDATSDTDFAFELPGQARFRCNVFRDLAGMGAVFRQIPTKILSAEQLRLPKAVLDLCQLEKGLVVVTGPTGSGKSTTLAAMIDHININRTDHIITIEDPVEFVHPDKGCLVNQREVGKSTKSFKSALRAALREDPDIVLVGEMRDLETVAIAIETAETGHLVFGTLHTNTAASTVDRIIDQFPADRQAQIRTMLSESLKGVVAQTLLKKKGGGRVAALEILVVTSAIANMIREGKTFQINSIMQTGKGVGMQTISDAMLELVKAGVVEPQEAFDRSPVKKEFGYILTRAGFKGPWSTEAEKS